MPYIGRGPAKSGAFRILDDVSGSFNGSTTSFALTVGSAALTVGLPETLLIAVDGVIQEAGSAYTISGSNIVFGSAPQDSATFWGVELGDVGGIAEQAITQSASNDSTKIATTAYVDNQIDVQLTAEDLDVTGDSGTIAIDLDSEALAITGGTGITTAATGNAVNIVGHAEAHTVASHSDTTGTGAELETLTDGSNAESLHTHTHTVVSHSDTTATGAELESLTDGSANITLHTHAASGAFTREGGTTTEVTHNATSSTQILASGTVSIPATTPMLLTVNSRKTSGAASQCRLQWQLNTTVDHERAIHGASNQAESFIGRAWVGARATGYTTIIMTTENSSGPNNTVHHNSGSIAMPIATLTAVDLFANALNSSQTQGCNYLHVYTHAVS